MPTLRDVRQGLGQKLTGFYRGTVSINPDTTDTLAQRSILSAGLYDADKNTKGFTDSFAWSGKYKDQRRVRNNGYRSLAYAVYTPPTSGTYTITFYGSGTTASIAYDALQPAIEAAVTPILSSATVAIVGGDVIITLGDVTDTEISAGTMLAPGAVGALEVNRSFTKALVKGDEFELHSKLPVLDYDNVQGLNTIINMALRRMWFIDRFPITPTTNVVGVKQFYGLTDYDWLTHKGQVIGVFNPTEWKMTATWTPPVSGSYTLQLDMGVEAFVTDSLAYGATAAEVEAELESATGLGFTVTGTSPLTIVLDRTWYASPILTSSSGTPTITIEMLASPSRYTGGWNFQYDGETPYLDNYLDGIEGRSFLIEAYRTASTWICPQSSYGIEGTVWFPSTEGLVDDYDQCVPPVEDIVSVAYAIACKQLSLVGPGNETDYWRQEERSATRVAAAVKMFDLPFEDKPRGGRGGFGSGYGNKGFWGSY